MQYVGNGNLVWDLGSLAGTLGNLVVIVELRVGLAGNLRICLGIGCQGFAKFCWDVVHVAGIWEIWLGCCKFAWDLVDLHRILEIWLGFAKFHWDMGNLVGDWEIWMGFGRFGWDLIGVARIWATDKLTTR